MSKKVQGIVVSNRGQKTAIVKVVRTKIHPIYKKRYRQSKRYAAHDPKNQAQVGQTVILVASRPISKTKHWLLEKVVQEATNLAEVKNSTKEKAAEVEEELS